MNKRRRRKAKAAARHHKRAMREFALMADVTFSLWPSAEVACRSERVPSLLEEVGPSRYLSLGALIEEKARQGGIRVVRLSTEEDGCVFDPSSDLEAVVNIMARHLAPNSTGGSR